MKTHGETTVLLNKKNLRLLFDPLLQGLAIRFSNPQLGNQL